MIEPKLIEKRLLKKILKKKYKNKNTNMKILSSTKSFLVSNWYFILIISFIVFLMYLKRKEKLENTKPIIKQKRKPETLVNSQSYENDYYRQIKKVEGLPINNHPHLNNIHNVIPM